MIRETGKNYVIGQIVYPKDANGLYYVCTQGGQTRKSTEGTSGSSEPIWNENSAVIDNYLVWSPLPHDPNESVEEWEPNTVYHLGSKVSPNSISFKGLYSYILRKIIVEPDWPQKEGTVVVDGTVEWLAKISVQSFIPKELRKNELHVEFYQLVDYLIESRSLNLTDAIYKHKDRSRISTEALHKYIIESGYEYIVNVLSLTKTQLETLSDYINLIHFLKGTRKGLELVLNLLGIVATITEWWEEDPPAEANTFALDLEFNLGNIKYDTVSRITDFTANYVFPKLREIVISYEAVIANLQTSIAYAPDQDMQVSGEENSVMSVVTGVQVETTVFLPTYIPPIYLLTLEDKTVLALPGDVIFALV